MLPVDHPRFRPARELIDNHQFAEAIQQLDMLLPQLNPEDRGAALYWKIVTLRCLSDAQQTKMCLKEALSQADIHYSIRICLELENAFFGGGDGPEKAVTEIRSVLQRYAKQLSTPDYFWQYVDAKRFLGDALLVIGNYSEAIKELEQAVSLDPRPGARYKARLRLEDAYYRSGDLDSARGHLEHALIDGQSASKAHVHDDHPAFIRYELALIAYRQHRFKDAEHELALASAAAKHPKYIAAITKLNSLLDQARQSNCW